MPPILSVSEAARLLGVTPRTVRNLIVRGRFPGAFRIDPLARRSNYRIPLDDIERFLALRDASQNINNRIEFGVDEA